MKDLCSAGTASVIIALTDGELNDWQFDTAQREVRCPTGVLFLWVSILFLFVTFKLLLIFSFIAALDCEFRVF